MAGNEQVSFGDRVVGAQESAGIDISSHVGKRVAIADATYGS